VHREAAMMIDVLAMAGKYGRCMAAGVEQMGHSRGQIQMAMREDPQPCSLGRVPCIFAGRSHSPTPPHPNVRTSSNIHHFTSTFATFSAADLSHAPLPIPLYDPKKQRR